MFTYKDFCQTWHIDLIKPDESLLMKVITAKFVMYILGCFITFVNVKNNVKYLL